MLRFSRRAILSRRFKQPVPDIVRHGRLDLFIRRPLDMYVVDRAILADYEINAKRRLNTGMLGCTPFVRSAVVKKLGIRGDRVAVKIVAADEQGIERAHHASRWKVSPGRAVHASMRE